MNRLPNTVAVFGGGVEAADIVLRSVLKLKEHEAPAIILDYTGRGALALGANNKMSLERFPVLWINGADRRRPTALFQLRQSDHFRRTFGRVLYDIQRIAKADVKPATIAWATEAAFDLSRSGTVGLGALLKSLSLPETRRWFLETQKDPEDLASFLNMLKWSMAYPAVYGLSEGENDIGLAEALDRKGVVWVESPMELFESGEYAITACLIDAAMEYAVRSALDRDRQTGRHRGMMTVVHLFPQRVMGGALPEWVKETCQEVKHVGVHHFSHSRRISQLQESWAKEAGSLWVVGKMPRLSTDSHASWLSRQEIEHIGNLGSGKVWIRSNETGKAMIVKVKDSNREIDLAHQFRVEAAKGRKIIPISQMSSALVGISHADLEGGNLYARLCDRELLRLGWLKTQTARKGSHGADGITIEQFKEHLEEELTSLVEELENGTYRCNALRKAQIPKSDGTKRDIGIAAVRDRVVQVACIHLLEPLFEPFFSRFSLPFVPEEAPITPCPWRAVLSPRGGPG